MKYLKDLFKKVLPARLWTLLRLLRLRASLALYRRRLVRHSYGGFTLDISLEDPLGQGWYDQDWPELPEIALLRRHGLKSGARVFDLGAHQCVVALMLAKIVGLEGQVLAVEANPHNAEVGRRNRDLNLARQLEVINAAVAEKSGTAVFNRGLNGQMDDGAGLWGRMEVPALSIDELARRYGLPQVLFIDVEGFECQALRGARETLRHGPDCYVEVHVGMGLEQLGGSVREILSFFPQNSYDLYVAGAGDAHAPFAPLTPGADLSGKMFLLVAIHREMPPGYLCRSLK